LYTAVSAEFHFACSFPHPQPHPHTSPFLFLRKECEKSLWWSLLLLFPNSDHNFHTQRCNRNILDGWSSYWENVTRLGGSGKAFVHSKDRVTWGCYVCCTVHCDVIMQHKPAKCILFQINTLLQFFFKFFMSSTCFEPQRFILRKTAVK
jgi:hypothetical protein